MRKQIIPFIVALFMALSAQAYDFSVTTNGQTLYYYIYDGAATVTFPKPSSSGNFWSGYTMPAGNVVIPDSVTYNNTTYAVKAIGFFVFENCSGIVSVTIPKTVDTIFDGAFRGCTSLIEVNLQSDNPPAVCQYTGTSSGYIVETASTTTFGNNANGRVFNIPCGSMEDYSTCTFWNLFSADLREPEAPNFNVWISSNDSIIGLGPGPWTWYDIDIRCDSSATVEANVTIYGFRFSHWEDGSTDNPRILHLTHDTILSATYVRDSAWVEVVCEDSSIGTIQGGGWYAIYDSAIFTAVPSEHYHLTYWTVAMEHSFFSYDTPLRQNPLELYIEGQTTLTAHFAIDTHSVSVSSSDITRGRVEGGGDFEYGTPCTVSAEAYSGYHFSHWSNGATYNPYTFAVTEDTELIAIFLAEGEVGIGTVEGNDITIRIDQGRVVADGTLDKVLVYDMVGRNVRNEALPAGMYIVKVGNHYARKVVMIQ